MSGDMLAFLREKNPNLPIYSVEDARFAPYGRVLGRAQAELTGALEALDIPPEGNAYIASAPELEALQSVMELGKAVFGGMDYQAGFCNGRGHMLNAFEYHKCSEVNCTSTGCVLLLALQSDMRGAALDSSSAVGFYLPPETVAEVYPMTLHFAPCRTSPGGFNCLVMLERGVNSPLPNVDVSAPGEQAMLWMRGKWLICHPDSPQAGKGAHVGISGENIELSI